MAYKEEEFWNHAFQVHSQDEFVYCQIFFFILQWKYSISHIKLQGKAKGPSPDPTLGEETAVWSGVSECLYRGRPHFSPPVRTPRPAGTWTTYLLERSTARGLGGGMMRPTEGTSMSTPPGPVTYHLLRSLLSFRIHSSPLWTIFCKASSTVFWLDPQAYIFIFLLKKQKRPQGPHAKCFSFETLNFSSIQADLDTTQQDWCFKYNRWVYKVCLKGIRRSDFPGDS